MQNKPRFWHLSCLRIGFFTVVIKQKLGQFWKKLNQIEPTLCISFPNCLFGDIVSTPLYPGPHTADMKLGAAEANIPNPYLHTFRKRPCQKGRDGFPA